MRWFARCGAGGGFAGVGGSVGSVSAGAVGVGGDAGGVPGGIVRAAGGGCGGGVVAAVCLGGSSGFLSDGWLAMFFVVASGGFPVSRLWAGVR